MKLCQQSNLNIIYYYENTVLISQLTEEKLEVLANYYIVNRKLKSCKNRLL